MAKKKNLFAKGSTQPNTFIGGLAYLYPTAADFAAVTNGTLIASDIKVFKVNGDNISFYVDKNYTWSDGRVRYNTNFTYYNDYADRLTVVGGSLRECTNWYEFRWNAVKILQDQTFYRVDSLKEIFLPAATYAGDYCFFRNETNLKAIYLPVLTSCSSTDVFARNSVLEELYIPIAKNLGNDTVLDSIFFLINPSCVVYVDPYIMTVNAGNPNPDIQYVIDRGCDVRPVTDFTIPDKPNAPTLIMTYGHTIVLQMPTEPTSANPFDFWRYYLYGQRIGKTYDDTLEIQVGSTSRLYEIQVEAVDYFYNHSESSDVLEVVTNMNYTPISDLTASFVGYDYVELDFTDTIPATEIKEYRVFVDGVYNSTYTDKNNVVAYPLTHNQTYDITVRVVDIYDNELADSNTLVQLVDGTKNYITNFIISEYKFENNVLDTVGSNDGVATNLTYADGMISRMGVFNGANSYVSLPADIFVSQKEFTVSMLINIKGSAEQRFLSLQANTDTCGLLFRWSSAINLSIGVRDATSLKQSNTPITTNTDFSLVVVVEQDVEFRVYIDGILEQTVPLDTGFNSITPAVNHIGTSRRLGEWFDGDLDALKFWNKKLTPEQALQLATDELAGIDINP